jgi:hypothetical protein
VCALSLIDELAETHPEIAAELKEARGWTLQASEDWKLKLGAPEPRGEGDPWHLLHGHLVLAAKEMPPSSLIEEAQRAAERAAFEAEQAQRRAERQARERPVAGNSGDLDF